MYIYFRSVNQYRRNRKLSVGKIKKSDIEDIVEINPVQEGMLFYYLEDPESLSLIHI